MHFPKCLCVEISALIGHISCVIITDLLSKSDIAMARSNIFKNTSNIQTNRLKTADFENYIF